MKNSIILSALVSVIAVGCSQPAKTNSVSKPSASAPAAPAAETPTVEPPGTAPESAPSVSNVKTLPPTGGDIPQPGEVKGYKYTYKKDATKTVATFAGKHLPADNNMMLDAVRDVVERSYGDKVVSAPRITGSGPSRTMRVASKKFDYLVVLVNDEHGEVLAMIVTQMELSTSP